MKKYNYDAFRQVFNLKSLYEYKIFEYGKDAYICCVLDENEYRPYFSDDELVYIVELDDTFNMSKEYINKGYTLIFFKDNKYYRYLYTLNEDSEHPRYVTRQIREFGFEKRMNK